MGSMFERDGERVVPREWALGPWGGNVLHGGAVAALLAHALEAKRPDAGWQPARLCVDLVRAVPFAPLELEVEVLRDGSRTKLVEARLRADDKLVSRASALLLRKTAEPAGDYRQTREIALPPRSDLPDVSSDRKSITHATSLKVHALPRYDTGMLNLDRGMWIRIPYTVMPGEPLTPFTRAATVSDWANTVASVKPEGLRYINSDITLYLYREPEGEWLGIAPGVRHSADGVKLSDCPLYDESGAVGRCLVACLATGAAANADNAVRPNPPPSG